MPIAGAAAARKEFGELTEVLGAAGIKVAAALAPALAELVDIMVDVVVTTSDAIAAIHEFLDPTSDLELATDNLVAAMGDEIRQSHLLEAAIGQGTKISVSAANQKYAEAKARHENVHAIIAEHQALALGSQEFATLSEQIKGAAAALNATGFTHLDMGVGQRADAFEEQQQHLADLLIKRQGLLKVNEEMNAQLERTAANIEELESAIDGASGGVVDLGGDVIRPISPSERAEEKERKRREAREASAGSSGGGRSGSEEELTREDFEALELSFAEERDLIEAGYGAKLALLEEYRASKLASEDEFNQLEARIHKDHLEAMVALDEQRRRATLDGVNGMFGDLSSLMRSENEKLFKIGKAASIAQATVKGYEAAVSAWEKGMKIGGPGLAAAFTAASLAKTGVLISSIASQSPNGGGGGASGGGAVAPVASTPAAPDPAQQVNITLGGAGIFPRQAILDLIGQINDATADGAQITVN